MTHQIFVEESVRLAKFQAEPNDEAVLAAQAEWRAADQSLFTAVREQVMNEFKYEVEDGAAVITGYTGVGGDVVVPAEIGGLPVTTIGIGAFYNCSGLTSITLPNSITTIGASAFFNCTGLTSVRFPDSITTIGKYAFQFCTGLTIIHLPSGLTTIGDYAFYECPSLTHVLLPNRGSAIGKHAFSAQTTVWS